MPSTVSKSRTTSSTVAGRCVAVCLRAKERYDQLRAQAVIDELTGVYNRRYLEEVGSKKIAEALRHKESTCLLMLDLDHFKEVNDTHGFAGALRTCVPRPGFPDVLVRLCAERR